MGKSSEDSVALEQLSAADLADVAAQLFATTFRPGVKSPQAFRNVRNDLSKMAGLGRLGVFTTAEPSYVIALECTLLWERALLAARISAGDSATLYVHLLRRGEAIRTSPDPHGAARAALGNLTIPPMLP